MVKSGKAHRALAPDRALASGGQAPRALRRGAGGVGDQPGAHRPASNALAPRRSRDVGPPSFLERPPRPGAAARVRDPRRPRDRSGAGGPGQVVWPEDRLSGAWGDGERPGGARGSRGPLAGAGFGRAAGAFGPSRAESKGAGGRLRPGLEAAPGAVV